MAVERQADFEAQSVAAAETAGSGAPFDEAIPEADDHSGGAVDLEAVFTGIARARDQRLVAVDLELAEVIEFEVFQVDSHDLAHDLFGVGALESQFADFIGDICQSNVIVAVGLHLLFEPGEILVDVRSVDNEQNRLRAALVDEQVVDNAAVVARKHSVGYLTGGHRSHLVGEHAVDELNGVGAFDEELAHVADVEKAGGLAHCVMFFCYAAILYRHVPARKGAHHCSHGHVAVVEAGLFNIAHGFVDKVTPQI